MLATSKDCKYLFVFWSSLSRLESSRSEQKVKCQFYLHLWSFVCFYNCRWCRFWPDVTRLVPVWWILPRYISVGGSMSREEYQISWWSAIIVKYCDRGGNTSVLDRVRIPNGVLKSDSVNTTIMKSYQSQNMKLLQNITLPEVSPSPSSQYPTISVWVTATTAGTWLFAFILK